MFSSSRITCIIIIIIVIIIIRIYIYIYIYIYIKAGPPGKRRGILIPVRTSHT